MAQLRVAASADIDFFRPTTVGDVLTAYPLERVTSGRSGVHDVTVTHGGLVAGFPGPDRPR